MADISGAYDANAEAAGEYELIPPGEYEAQIIEADIEEISQRNDYGRCLKLTWQITSGDYENRLIWQRLSLWPSQNMNNAAKVGEIANSQFAAIRKATGKEMPTDTDELLFLPCLVGLKIRHDKTGQYDPQNEVKGVKPLAGQAAPAKVPNRPIPPNGGPQNGQVLHQRKAPPRTPPKAAANKPGGRAPWSNAADADDDVPF